MGKTYIKTPLLNNYLYDLCYNLPTETVKTLPIKYRRILFSERATKNFCEKSTIDEKLHFFHYIGLTNSLTVFPESIKGKNQVKEFFKKYDEEKLASVQKEHAMLNIYCSTDKETSHLMGLMAMTISGKDFIINLDYNKTAFHLKEWGKRLISAESNLFDETVESADLVAQTMLNTVVSMDAGEILHEVNKNDIKVLFYLYQKRSKYIGKEIIQAYFITTVTKAKITSSIKRLLLAGFINKHIDWKNQRYTINAKGINLVYDFMKRILKKNNFE